MYFDPIRVDPESEIVAARGPRLHPATCPTQSAKTGPEADRPLLLFGIPDTYHVASRPIASIRYWPCYVILVAPAIVSYISCRGGRTQDSPVPVRVAVAANFSAAHEQIARQFQVTSGLHVETSLGATGQLYAQIRNGAPYDVFLAADTVRPALLESQGLAVPGSRFTYALGRLAMLAPRWDSVRSADSELRSRPYQHLAIANPTIAPYGAAAQQVLEQLGLWPELRSRIVRGENVGQTYQFVVSGAAEVGFVAMSQLQNHPARSFWTVPEQLHDPIRQDAVLLQRGAHNAGARAFLDFVKSEAGRQVTISFGYGVP